MQSGSAQAERPGGRGRGCVASPEGETTTAARKRAGVQQSAQAEGNGIGTGAASAKPRKGRARPSGGAPLRVIAKAGLGETGSPPVEPIRGSKAPGAGQGTSHSSFVSRTASTLQPQAPFRAPSCESNRKRIFPPAPAAGPAARNASSRTGCPGPMEQWIGPEQGTGVEGRTERTVHAARLGGSRPGGSPHGASRTSTEAVSKAGLEGSVSFTYWNERTIRVESGLGGAATAPIPYEEIAPAFAKPAP